MAVEMGAIAPWLDNYPVYRQLWQGNARTPGSELDLVPLNRNLTVQWRSVKTGNIVFASTELLSRPAITVFNKVRGVVEIVVFGESWKYFKYDDSYICEVIAYGFLYDSFPWGLGLPAPSVELVGGAEVYGAPREILELIGRIPGAEVEINVPLVGGWTLNAQGYWQNYVSKELQLFGLFINDAHARQVSYAELALGCDRQYARVTGDSADIIYYKGTENLGDPFTYVETCHNRYVLRCLQEATAEFDRKTGTFFNKKRVFREVHQGKYRQSQLSLRTAPVTVDRYFRLDSFSFSRDVVRRYTEDYVAGRDASLYRSYFGSQSLHVDEPTGVVTIASSLFDWGDSWASGGSYGAGFLASGENNIEATYTAGYDYIPTDISEAIGNMAAIRQAVFWQQNITQGMNAISIGCANLNFGEMFQKWTPGWQSGADAIASSYQRQMIEAF